MTNESNESKEPSKNDSKEHKPSEKVEPLVHLTAGALARTTSSVLLHPIDLIKTRMQFQRKTHQLFQNVYYRNGVHAFSSILKSEGPFALFKGLSVRLLYNVPSAALSFSVYEQVKHWFFGESTQSMFIVVAISGLGYRMLSTAVRTPFDVLKQQIQVQGMISHGEAAPNPQTSAVKGAGGIVRKTMGHIMTERSYSGFFEGFGIAFARDTFFSLFYFGSYEYSKFLYRYYISKKPKSVVGSIGRDMVCGAIAGIIGTCVSLPMDVLKTRIQTQLQLPPAERIYTGVIATYKHTVHTEGFRALFRGLGPRLSQTIPAASITLASYEQYKNIINYLFFP